MILVSNMIFKVISGLMVWSGSTLNIALSVKKANKAAMYSRSSGRSRMCKRRGRKPHFGWKKGVLPSLYANIYVNVCYLDWKILDLQHHYLLKYSNVKMAQKLSFTIIWVKSTDTRHVKLAISQKIFGLCGNLKKIWDKVRGAFVEMTWTDPISI